MRLIAATFLIALFPAIAAAEPAGMPADAAMLESWSADQVRRWAIANSPAANSLDAERRALGRQVDRRDAKQCARVGLWQAVLREVARNERNNSAGEALTAYYRIIGLQLQIDLLLEAEDELAALLKFAEQAEALALPDGDSNELRRRQIEIQDQLLQAEFGLKKLRLRLAQLTGQPEGVTEVAVLTDPLDLLRIEMDRHSAVAEAIASRGDLGGIRVLCRCMNEDTLPAARSMLGVLQPGLGLSVAGAAQCLLKKLRSLCSLRGNENSDLHARRHQCRLLERDTEDAIGAQVMQAHLDLQQAIARRSLGDATAKLANEAFDQQAKAVELDQAAVGSDRLDKLVSLKADGEAIQRLVDVAVAEVAFRQAMGILNK